MQIGLIILEWALLEGFLVKKDTIDKDIVESVAIGLGLKEEEVKKTAKRREM